MLIAFAVIGFGDAGAPTPANAQGATLPVRVAYDGEVSGVRGDRLRLGEGSEAVLVDVEGIEYLDDRRARLGLRGERVVVYGTFGEGNRTIDADTVFIDALSSYVHAGSEAEAAFGRWTSPAADEQTTGVRSRVVAIEEGTLRLTSPAGAITVDTTSLAFDPLDEQGAVRLSVGDRVEVWGSLEGDLFHEPTLVASDLTRL